MCQVSDKIGYFSVLHFWPHGDPWIFQQYQRVAIAHTHSLFWRTRIVVLEFLGGNGRVDHGALRYKVPYLYYGVMRYRAL